MIHIYPIHHRHHIYIYIDPIFIWKHSTDCIQTKLKMTIFYDIEFPFKIFDFRYDFTSSKIGGVLYTSRKWYPENVDKKCERMDDVFPKCELIPYCLLFCFM